MLTCYRKTCVYVYMFCKSYTAISWVYFWVKMWVLKCSVVERKTFHLCSVWSQYYYVDVKHVPQEIRTWTKYEQQHRMDRSRMQNGLILRTGYFGSTLEVHEERRRDGQDNHNREKIGLDWERHMSKKSNIILSSTNNNFIW